MMKLEELIDWYNNLTPESLCEISNIYSEWTHFRDPFNSVQGHKEISDIFHHMFTNTEDPRFEITGVMEHNSTAWINWTFRCGIRGIQVSVEGASQLHFNSDGRVNSHRDFWDSNELLAQLPIAGTIVRYLKNRLSASNQKNSSEISHE